MDLIFEPNREILTKRGCRGRLIEKLKEGLWLVNFGQAGNFRLFESEMELC